MGTKAFFAAKVQGGLDELYRAIDDDALRTFIQQKFLPCAWYDVLPAVPLIRAEAKAMHHTVRRYLQIRSGYQAEQDLGGIYRFLLRVAATESVAMRMPQLFTQIFDFGSSDAELEEPGHVIGWVRDFPAALHEWFAIALEAYTLTALRLTGARDCTVSSRKVDATHAGHGPAHAGGIPLSSLRIDFHWRA